MWSSDHAAPGFWLSLLWGRGGGAVLISRGDFRAPGLSLRVGRDEGMFEGFDGCIGGLMAPWDYSDLVGCFGIERDDALEFN